MKLLQEQQQLLAKSSSTGSVVEVVNLCSHCCRRCTDEFRFSGRRGKFYPPAKNTLHAREEFGCVVLQNMKFLKHNSLQVSSCPGDFEAQNPSGNIGKKGTIHSRRTTIRCLRLLTDGIFQSRQSSAIHCTKIL